MSSQFSWKSRMDPKVVFDKSASIIPKRSVSNKGSEASLTSTSTGTDAYYDMHWIILLHICPRAIILYRAFLLDQSWKIGRAATKKKKNRKKRAKNNRTFRLR